MPRDYEQSARALIDAAEKAVEKAVAPLLKRIADLEAQTPAVGDKGDPGQQGERGEPGTDGNDGIGLAAALINREGELVVTTTDGQVRELGIVVGRDGKDGIDGKDGSPGRDGADGAPGEQGERGDAGDPGKDGQDAYPGEPRGLFDATAEYRARDVVALNGSAFMAKRDNPGDCPGEGWMLLVQRGKRGETGERGERGAEGPAGKSAAELVGLGFNADAMTFFGVLDNGEQLEADFGPVAQKIIEALRSE